MMQPTWKDDLLSLHQQRKNYLKSLRYLYEQSSKVSRVSVTTHNEIEVTKERLHEVEKQILKMQEALGNEVENTGLRKIEGFSLYLPGEQDAEVENAAAFQGLSNQRHVFQDQEHTTRLLYLKILLIITAVITFSFGLFIFERPYLGTFLSSTPQTSREIPIYPGYYHIGDAYLQEFHSPNPQPNPFISNFRIAAIGTDPHLILTASHVDPNVTQSPVFIFVNDNSVDYLNSYFTEETIAPKQVSIPVNVSFLKTGDNKIRIESHMTTVEYQAPNLDDFEFWDVKLEFSGGK